MPNAGIRFFATNREMEQLANAVRATDADEKRQKRLNLQKGGYYFVDMNAYMSYYFAEVDAARMPPMAVVEDSNTTVFEEFLADPRITRVVVCVHGFNVNLHDSHIWFRILIETMRKLPGCADRIVADPADDSFKDDDAKDLCAFVGFSWPSNGSVLAYNRDQLDAASSAQALAGLISRLHTWNKQVDLICHSMGNYAACKMLQGLVNKEFVPACFTAVYLKETDVAAGRAVLSANEYQERATRLLHLIDRADKEDQTEIVERDKWFIGNFVMIAPDVERRHVTKAEDRSGSDYIGPFYAGLQHLTRNVHNVYSRFDGALNISNVEKKPKDIILSVGERINSLAFGMLSFLERNPDYKWEARLGVGPHPSSAPPNVQSINATELAGRPIDHSDHIDSTNVVSAIACALRLGPY